MFKPFVGNLGEEERAVFLQGFKAVPHFLTMLHAMVESLKTSLSNLDSVDPNMPFEHKRLRAERDLLLEMIQVIEE